MTIVDRLCWAALLQLWSEWEGPLILVTPQNRGTLFLAAETRQWYCLQITP